MGSNGVLAFYLFLSFAVKDVGATIFFVNGESNRLVRPWGGADGVFSDGPVQTGISGTYPNFTINTDEKSEFKFSSLTISAGVTVTVTGSSPLILRVAGDAVVAGTLSVSATDHPGGTPNGGSGGPGGFAGGKGAIRSPLTDPLDASPSSGPSRGGNAGVNVGGGGGLNQAGGGGCNGPGATDGSNNVGSGATCPSTTAQIAENFENVFVGGGGGSGGGIYTVAGAADGVGGGGGGGAVHLVVGEDLSLTGAIEAKGAIGGAEGAVDVADCPSPGGAGSGGSIWVQVGGTLSGSGTLDVSGGTSAVGANCAYTAGNGSAGVVRIDSTNNGFTGTFTPTGTVDLSYSLTVADFSSFRLGGSYWACSEAVKTELEKTPAFPVSFFLVLLFLAYLRVRSEKGSKVKGKSCTPI